jgi:uncharacterized protein involved in response to NO
MTPSESFFEMDHDAVALIRERGKSWMLRAWILSGLFFMALPGTLLGFSNLMSISTHHGLGSMPAAWMEGHGHAQLFGWIGSFILGIGFYSQPSRGRSAQRLPMMCFALWTSGVLLRWLANIYEWHWRPLLAISSFFEVVAVLLFLGAARHHKRPEPGPQGAPRKGMEAWMIAVLLSTAVLAAGVIFNFVECVRLALYAAAPSFPHLLDQKYLLLLGWGFLAPVVWGFSARWLPAFLALDQPRTRALGLALLFDVAGIAFGIARMLAVATSLLVAAAITVIFALRLFESPRGRAKVQGIHPSFPVFIRIAYRWLAIAAAMSVWAALSDQHGGIWGASRHALTVGFAATMVFSIGPRILPHFCGVRKLFSAHLMFASLLLLQTGCLLRVSSEPLAYEGIAGFAWRVLPVSGMFELAGVLIFALNMAATIALERSMFETAPAKNQPVVT